MSQDANFVAVVGVGYALMLVAQNFGPEVIELLHGHEARLKATAPQYDDVHPDSSLEKLCEGYDAHHFHDTSNCLHAAGMILAIFSVVCLVISKRIRVLLTLPPIWYLYAWIGHFFFQKDIPAVFVYGMTLRGWLSGEYCSMCSLLAGRTISLPWEIGLTGLIILVHLYLLPPIPNWGLYSSSKSKST